MALALKNIRALAKDHDYIEIEMNKKSKLISFRKGSTRINIYFTTGTVGTCLNHPKRGKTQLFRRNVDMDQLNDIFDNPRVHTGTGYYRKHITQEWKYSGSNDNRGNFLVDSAMRWRYVGRATGLIKSEEDMKLLCDICTLHDELFFEKNSVPDLRKTRYGCGSVCALMRIVFIAYKKRFGEFQVMDLNENKFDSFEGFPLENLNYGLCENAHMFLSDHKVQLMAFLSKVMSVENNDIAFELMNWFLGRSHAGCRFAHLSSKQKTSSFSEKVESAHTEYGKLMYPKKAGLCPHCGIRYTDHEE